MKKTLLLLGLAFIAGTSLSYGQMTSKEIAEMATEQSIEMKGDGWKPKAGSAPLKNQLIKAYTMMEEQVNGQNKYIIADGQVKGSTFETARVHAMEIAKRNMISLIDNMSLTETEGGSINVEGESVEGENLSDTKYKNTSSLELGNLTTILTCYRQLPDGKVEVLVQLACTRENAVKAKLKKAKGASKPQGEAPKVTSSHTL